PGCTLSLRVPARRAPRAELPPAPRLAFLRRSRPCIVVSRRVPLLLIGFVCATVHLARAEPLSKKTDIDFFRDVASRDLKGLATRSDGRLVAGPRLTEIFAAPPAELMWCLEPAGDPAK